MLLDRYFVNSLKNVTRDSEGDGERYNTVSNIPIYRNLKNFMGKPEKKAELFRLVRKFVKALI